MAQTSGSLHPRTFRACVDGRGVAAAATVEAPPLEGGFFIEATLSIVTNTHSENTCGSAFLGVDAAGGTSAFYLADVKPAGNAARLVKVSSPNVFLIDNEPLPFLLDSALPFTISAEGAYEDTALRITLTVRQSSRESIHVQEERIPLAGSHFGLRCRTNGSSLSLDDDDFLLRPLSHVEFPTFPSPFARPGILYETTVAAESSVGGNVTIAAEELPAWPTVTAPVFSGSASSPARPSTISLSPGLDRTRSDYAGKSRSSHPEPIPRLQSRAFRPHGSRRGNIADAASVGGTG